MATVLLITDGGMPIIVTGTTAAAISTLVTAAYAVSPTVVSDFTEQAMGAIKVNLRNIAYWREI